MMRIAPVVFIDAMLPTRKSDVRCNVKMITVLFATLALASCDRAVGGPSGITFSATPSIGVVISPQVVPIAQVTTVACAMVPTFTTNFNLVITASAVNVSVDSVTFRLLDGSGLGGPMITVPKPGLDQMFGSTLVVGSRAFAFQPVFGCGVIQARSIAAEVVLVDSTGTARNVTVSASVQ
jgi:hypothetical protein